MSEMRNVARNLACWVRLSFCYRHSSMRCSRHTFITNILSINVYSLKTVLSIHTNNVHKATRHEFQYLPFYVIDSIGTEETKSSGSVPEICCRSLPNGSYKAPRWLGDSTDRRAKSPLCIINVMNKSHFSFLYKNK